MQRTSHYILYSHPIHVPRKCIVCCGYQKVSHEHSHLHTAAVTDRFLAQFKQVPPWQAPAQDRTPNVDLRGAAMRRMCRDVNECRNDAARVVTVANTDQQGDNQMGPTLDEDKGIQRRSRCVKR